MIMEIMAVGNILITKEGAEVSQISSSCLDSCVRAFYEMYYKAMESGDRFYVLEAMMAEQYSYGEYYPAFLHLDWESFHNIPSLSAISFSTYYFIMNALTNLPRKIDGEISFSHLEEPRGKGGFQYPGCKVDFIYDIPKWNSWHHNFLLSHPQVIEWTMHSFLPNISKTLEIIEEELVLHLGEEEIDKRLKNKDFHIEEKFDKPLKGNAKTLLFHRDVMSIYPAGGGRQGYCMKIGKAICECNYYQYEAELSSKEQQLCGSQRSIFSVLKEGHKQYISIDFEKGMFEFHNERGEHLGEFHYDGTQNGKARVDHNLHSIH